MNLRFETDLNFSRPGFSEIKVQIKRLIFSPYFSFFRKNIANFFLLNLLVQQKNTLNMLMQIEMEF